MFLFRDNNTEDIDYRALRKDLVDDAGIDSIVTGEFGLCDMIDAMDASEAELRQMAMERGINLKKYMK